MSIFGFGKKEKKEKNNTTLSNTDQDLSSSLSSTLTLNQIMQMPSSVGESQGTQQLFNQSSSSLSYHHQNNSNSCRRILIQESDRELSPCAVIVTILEGSSYDDLYRHTPQVSPDPTHTVVLFELHYNALEELFQAITQSEPVSGTPNSEILNEMMTCISQVDPDSVVFNYECCSACSESGIHIPHSEEPSPQHSSSSIVIPLVAELLQRKHIVMFGDFSLKGLIHDWNDTLLGPNPFINCGTTSSAMKLQFNPTQLTDCVNAQLQNVGRMCESGEAVVNVMSGTIVFKVNPIKTDTDRYVTQVLTRCVNSFDPDACGHVMLTYPSGGILLVSAGHWIELSSLNGVTEEAVYNMCTVQMGSEKAAQMMYELSNSSTAYEREQVIQRNAQEVVWSSAPCKYSSRR